MAATAGDGVQATIDDRRPPPPPSPAQRHENHLLGRGAGLMPTVR